MDEEEKKERIRFLWYRVRVIASANLFCVVLRKHQNMLEEQSMIRQGLRVSYDDAEKTL